MNKLFTKIAGLSLGLAMAIGVGVAVGSKEAKVAGATAIPAANLSSSSTCTVSGTDGVKANKAAAATITVPKEAGNCDVTFHAAAWNKEGCAHDITLTNATSSTSSITLTADSGVSGSGSSYTLSGSESTYEFTISLTQTSSSSDMVISIDGVTSKRFVVWGASYTSSGGTSYNYSVTYNGNGNTGGTVPSAQSGSGTSVTISNTVLTKAGFTHDGWAESTSGSVAYTLGQVVTLSGDLTKALYAHWTAQTYSVTYNGNGNTSGDVPTDATAYAYNASVTVSGANTLAKTDCTFNGWNTAADGTGTPFAANATFNITENVTLYAQWNEVVQSYDWQKVTSTSEFVDGTHILITQGNHYLDATTGSSSCPTVGSLTLSNNLPTLTANKTYCFTVSGSGESIKLAKATDTAKWLITGNANNGMRINTGDTGCYWTISSAGTNEFYLESDVGRYLSKYGSQDFRSYTNTGTNANLVLYKLVAAAPVQKYTVSFNGNGATGGSVPTETDILGDYTLPANGFTAPSGKVFAGWKANNTGSLLSAGDTYDVQADVEFYAQWSDVYTVSFNGNSASGSMADVPNVAGNYTLPSCGYTTPSGKEFLGWKANNAGDTLAVGATYLVNANVTFYAQWGNVWNVTFTAGTNGSGSAVISVSQGTYSLPAFSTLTGVSANTGYQFKDYTIGGSTYNAGAEVTISAATSVTVNFEVKPSETTYDFTTNFSTYTTGWTGYGTHEGLDGKTDIGGGYEATIDLYYASKQTSNINDRPVFATKTETGWTKVLQFTLTESDYKIDSIVVTFAQWTTKTPDVALYKGTTASGTSIDTATIGTKNTLSASNFNGTTFTVGYCDKKTDNVQAGITSIYISISPMSSFGTLDHISVTALPNVVYHVGETYSPTGLAVTAYDGADESTAAFKDVTASVVTDLDNPTPFVDSDVPGFDCDVQYTGDGGTDTISFHVYVYALAEYKLVTETPADWSGQYLIVDDGPDSSLVALNGGLSVIDNEGNYKNVTDSNDIITAGQELEWTIASYSTGYSIQGKSGKYIGSLTTTSNGMLVSDSAIFNSLSVSSGSTTIAGTNGYKLDFSTSADRFRYYSGSNTVKLYKLVESDKADEFAQLFLGAFTCDNSGINKPTFAWKEEGVTRWSWSLLITEYNTLTSVEKEQFRLGVASETGTNIEKAIARYDYIVGKYFKTGIDTSFTDFMNRNPAAIGSSRIMLATVTKNSGTTIAIVVISAVSLAAVGGYFFFRKKKEN